MPSLRRDNDAPDFHLPPHWRGPLVAPEDIGIRQPQWWTTQYGLEAWWNKGYDGTGVVVVVVDTGFAEHEDLAGQVVASVDATGEGVADGNSHSTHCSGIIAAIRNGRGVVGVAPGAKLVTAKGLKNNGSGSSTSLATAYRKGCTEAFKHAQVGVVTSNSYGGAGAISVLESEMQSWLAKGVLPAAAAGNDGTAGVDYPAAGPSALGVGAHDEARKLASFSDSGGEVDLVAPGVQILSTIPGGGYAKYSGTSMATPWVAGAIALRLSAEYKVLGKVVTKTIAQLNALLDKCCVDAGAVGRDPSFGRGFLDIDKWLTDGLVSLPPPPLGDRWRIAWPGVTTELTSPVEPKVTPII